jgi:uncharacterized membrane protein
MTNPTRTEAFSDGVLAVAITLLVLDLKVPHVESNLLAALLENWIVYAAYAVSFLTIGTIWVNHHDVLDRIERVDRPLQYLNLGLLMTVAVIPFSTSLLSEYLRAGHDAGIAAAVYGLNMAVMGAAFASIWLYAVRRGLIEGIDRRTADVFLARFGFGGPLYAVAMGAALIDPRLSLLVYAVLAVYYAAFVSVPGRPRHGHASPP